MDVIEALDREVIIERAEELRSWLAGLALSGRAIGALNRELGGIIANDPGGYINGQRPLAGITIADFIAELHSRNAGAVGRVKSVGDAVLTELRAAIPADAEVAHVAAEVVPEPEAAEAPAMTAEAPQAEVEAPKVEATAARRRGRPKGSTKAARNGAEASQDTPAPPQALSAAPQAVAPEAAAPEAAELLTTEAPKPSRRGRPRRTAAPAPASANAPALKAPTANGTTPAMSRGDAAPAQVSAPPVRKTAPAMHDIPTDPAFDQLVRLWPSLHPQARRAVVLYASTLLAEALYDK